MTYSDPKRVRTQRVTIRLDQYEHDLIMALANYQGDQPGTLVRELLMREAASVLSNNPTVQKTPA